MKSRFGVLALMVAVAFAQTGSKEKDKVDTCGFGGNIHSCHCVERVDKIRVADVKTCDDKKGTKGYDDCIKNALAGHDHCSIAERSTKWDTDGDGNYPDIHGDAVKSGMGEYCKRACKPHHCQCSEQSCDFH